MIGTALLMVGGVFAILGVEFAAILTLEWIADRLLERELQKRRVD